MLSVASVQSWYSMPFFFDREKTIGDEEIIKKIIRKTVSDKDNFKILDAGCADGKRLKEAVKRNPNVHCVGLVRRVGDIPCFWREQAYEQQISINVSELCKFRAAPEFDLMYLFEWFSHFPENQRMEMLQYCKMLIKPGGLLVTASEKNSHDPKLRPAALKGLLQRAGYYKVRNHRLTASLRLLTAERISKNL